MKSKRRHDSEFKARVAFEALKGTNTLQEYPLSIFSIIKLPPLSEGDAVQNLSHENV